MENALKMWNFHKVTKPPYSASSLDIGRIAPSGRANKMANEIRDLIEMKRLKLAYFVSIAQSSSSKRREMKMSDTINTASEQWSTRPSDERFVSLNELHSHCVEQREHSKAVIVSSWQLEARPVESGLQVFGPNGNGYNPTHWAFGQLAQRAESPAGYLRTLPAPLAADCINYGLRFKRSIEDVGVLLRKNGKSEIAAVTGPSYGRVWNADISRQLTQRFGDGVSGDWRVPGEFGHKVNVTKANTTIYASDRDMFVFLADETNRLELPGRRNGETGSLARGFYVWNSEVGSATFGIAMFLFDYVCCNRIIWGAREFRQIKMRHTVSAPQRFIHEVTPILRQLHNAPASSIEDTLKAAQAAKVKEDMAEFLAKRFTKSEAGGALKAFWTDENRKPETVWDAVTAVTAYARTIEYQDVRVDLEAKAGQLLELVAA